MITLNSSKEKGFDLMHLRPVRALFKQGWFPYLFQAIGLAVFIGLAVLAWGHYTPAGVNAKLYAKSNLATLVIWGIWWPGMVWVAVLFGRVWCMVRPLELVNNLSERLARGLGVRQFTLRRSVASGAVIVALYALIQFLVAGAHINRVPAYTSLFLIGLVTLPAITGFLFRDRGFCRGFCPVGLLLATYGRGGMLAVRPESGVNCRECAGNGCRAAANRQKADARSCPSLLNPSRLESNRDCILCGQCVKSCSSGNMRLFLRRPFHAGDLWERFASWPVTIFVMLVSGFVTWEICAEWPKAEELFLFLPDLVNGIIGIPVLTGYIDALWAILLFPLLLWSLIGMAMRLFGEPSGMGELWRRIALPVAVVVSAGHMSKGLAKFVTWAGFLPHALRNPDGTRTAVEISSGIMANPEALLSLPVVAAISALLIGVGVFYGARVARRSHPGTRYNGMLLRGAFAAIFMMVMLGHALSGR